ncbi:MAG: elongation factor Ts [Streptosporangiales bacterium]|nr:elongation factor Ts [Streptosporangiales bacterium]
MANFTAADVKRLRELTAAGMMDCKNALTEAEGDFDKAVEILRLKGARSVHKRAERTASNGLVAAHLVDGTLGVLLELNCETDFVAKNERFQELAAQLAEHDATTRPTDVPSLVESAADGGKTVQNLLEEASATLGEKLEIRRFALFDAGSVASYLHKTSPDLPPAIGVLVELGGADEETGKQLAQHIAAAAPAYLTREEVPAETVENERRIAEQIARDEGKPEQAIPKIVDGRVSAFFKDLVLFEQPWVRDPKQTVRKVLENTDVTVRRFVRYRVGQA